MYTYTSSNCRPISDGPITNLLQYCALSSGNAAGPAAGAAATESVKTAALISNLGFLLVVFQVSGVQQAWQ